MKVNDQDALNHHGSNDEKKSPAMGATIEYLAVGGNRRPAAADWDTATGLLAYGAGINVALWKPQDSHTLGIQSLLPGHADIINTVCFHTCRNEDYPILLTGSADSTIRVWRYDPDSKLLFNHDCTLTDHLRPINCITSLPASELIASSAADGTVKVWRIVPDQSQVQATLVQSLVLHPRSFALALAIHQLRNPDGVILAAAGTRSQIQVYVAGDCEGQSLEFLHAVTLTGHEGWIRSLDFVNERCGSGSDIILASASQDRHIRLWRLSQESVTTSHDLENGLNTYTDSSKLSNKAQPFMVNSCKYCFSFEALLLGHEDWIYSCYWRQSKVGLQILSASADNTLAIWEADTVSGVWICVTRLGELSAQKGSTTATGSTGGFWVGLWSPDGLSVVSLGRTGSWRRWVKREGMTTWTQQIGICGHTKAVNGLAWSRAGTYMLSASADQTTRLHAKWRRPHRESWHEFARPQIHGYDLSCVTSVHESQFVSGAEEKLLRVFNEPRLVAKLIRKLSKLTSHTDHLLPEAANMPVLGLSNKAAEVSREDDSILRAQGTVPLGEDPLENHILSLECPPFEDLLSRHTLWPEEEKIYGHGYDVSALACSTDGSLVATACKASSIEHAVIRIYETKQWREVSPALIAHSLTVTSLQFSDDNHFLLSTGRDRQWSIFYRLMQEQARYELMVSNPKGHSRMMLSSTWAPSAYGRAFATSSRDKTIKIWAGDSNDFTCKGIIQASASVTSVAFRQRDHNGVCVLAAGMDNGGLYIYSVVPGEWKLKACLKLNDAICPSLAVTHIAWQPSDEGEEKHRSLLAVGSEDHSVRIIRIEFGG